MGNPYYKLSSDEISFISDEVKKSGISFSHLEEELIDHICCMVEELVNDGYTFESALKSVKKNIGIDSLKEIEIQTLILINKKFNAMKKTLKISGIVGLSAIVISSILKMMHWPGAGPLLTLGFLTLLLAYLPALLLTLKKEKILKRNMNLAYFGMAAAFVLLVSLLFSLMQWPYREYPIVLSWIFTLIFLIMLFSNIMKSEENRVLNLSLLLFFSVLFILDVTLSLISLGNPRLSKLTLENNIDQGINLYKQKTLHIYELLGTIKDNTKANEIVEIRTKTDEIISKIEETRNSLFPNKSEQENFSKHLFKNYVITNAIEHNAMSLSKDITEYREFMIGKVVSQPDLKIFIESSLIFGQAEFNNDPPIIYNNLQKLIRDIKISESEILEEMK
jgi:hypothetical protein